MLSERALRAVARRAIRLLEQRGHRRGARGPGLCVLDAITEADPGRRYRFTLWARAEAVICATTRMRQGIGKSLLCRWNDRPGRTRDEAVDLLGRVAQSWSPARRRDLAQP